jgi:hypothetical protein
VIGWRKGSFSVIYAYNRANQKKSTVNVSEMHWALKCADLKIEVILDCTDLKGRSVVLPYPHETVCYLQLSTTLNRKIF